MIRKIINALPLAGGFIGGSQLPAFTQQYFQNLSGRIDELGPIARKYPEYAERLEKLRNCFAAMKDASVYNKSIQMFRYLDLQTAKSAWDKFKPGISFESETVILGLAGAAILFAICFLACSLLRKIYRVIRKKN
ncbi:MAG: DUF2937 family protein [Fusobacteriaceae bacterium]|jgi:hypothetical protein|nr:DUF2937 family protein [Fusobacteriaceae bacterium]